MDELTPAEKRILLASDMEVFGMPFDAWKKKDRRQRRISWAVFVLVMLSVAALQALGR